MSKHTPGPWRLLNSFDIFSELGADSGDGCPAASNDGWHVAVMPDTETNVDGIGKTELGWDVKRANARLIAAAPDLLEALEMLWREYKALADSGDAGFWSAEDTPEGMVALAAIAKATGEQP